MSDQPRSRQEIYQNIRKNSKAEFIYEDMIKLGFWGDGEEEPSLPEAFMKRRMELQKELRELVAKEHQLSDPEKLIKDYRKKRMAESRQKQQENREKRAQERLHRAQKWQERKSKEILYIGAHSNGALSQNESKTGGLTQKFNLPTFKNGLDLANAIGISLGELRFLSYHRAVSRISHYQRFWMPKKSGGKRLISAPMPRLKLVQNWILENILNKVGIHEAAHGFVKGRSLITNAKPHVGQDIVYNIDLKDFFPSIKYKRVKGVFANLGYSQKMATILASLCTEPFTQEVELDGVTYFVAQGESFLPQGAPTSPAITNILCYKMDKRIAGMAKGWGFNYTRYADDMTFSLSSQNEDWEEELLNPYKMLNKGIHLIIEEEGFTIHPDKSRVMRKGARQEVTGIVVNDELGVNRKKLRQFRALLHQIKQTGMQGKKWGEGADLASSIWGYANFVYMVKPEKGAKLLQEVKDIISKNGGQKKNPLQQKIKKLKKEQAKPKPNTPPPPKEDKKDDDKPGWKLW